MMIAVKLIKFSFTELPFVFFLVWCDKRFWKLYFFRVFPVLYSIIKYSHRACLLLRSLIDSSCIAATLYPLNNLSLFHHPPPPTPAPNFSSSREPVLLYLHEFDFILDSTYKWGHTIFVFLFLMHFTYHNVLKFQPYCHKWQGFLLSHGWIIFHWYIYNWFPDSGIELGSQSCLTLCDSMDWLYSPRNSPRPKYCSG